MKLDVFEECLRRQPWRPAPPSWREEILATALAAGRSAAGVKVEAGRWRVFWEFLLWPSPRAWAGVAVLWLVALGGHVVQHWTTPDSGRPLSLRAPERHETLPQRQRALAEWLDLTEPSFTPSAPPPAPPPGEGRTTTNRLG